MPEGKSIWLQSERLFLNYQIKSTQNTFIKHLFECLILSEIQVRTKYVPSLKTFLTPEEEILSHRYFPRRKKVAGAVIAVRRLRIWRASWELWFLSCSWDWSEVGPESENYGKEVRRKRKLSEQREGQVRGTRAARHADQFARYERRE